MLSNHFLLPIVAKEAITADGSHTGLCRPCSSLVKHTVTTTTAHVLSEYQGPRKKLLKTHIPILDQILSLYPDDQPLIQLLSTMFPDTLNKKKIHRLRLRMLASIICFMSDHRANGT